MDSYTRAAINAPRGPHRPAPLAIRALGTAAIFAATGAHLVFDIGGGIAFVARALGL